MDVQQFINSKAPLALNEKIPANSKVCFVDSSFNPPNWAHVKLGQLCQQAYPDCYVVFLLAIGNADKPTAPVEQLSHRVQMIELMMRTEFSGQNVRVGLTHEAFFIDKAAAAKAAIPDCDLVFAMGYDTLLRIADPKYYDAPVEVVLDQLFSYVNVLVLTRAEDEATSTPEMGPVDQQMDLNGTVFKQFEDHIHFQMSQPDTDNVCSSRGRSSADELKRVSPPEVAKYVLKHKIYK